MTNMCLKITKNEPKRRLRSLQHKTDVKQNYEFKKLKDWFSEGCTFAELFSNYDIMI